MRMMDCFFEVMYLTKNLVHQFENESEKDFDEVRVAIEKKITEGASLYQEGGYSHEHYQIALYGVVSLIDELLLLSKWDHKEQWRDDLLQVKYFQSVSAGEEFYHKLNGLSVFDPAEKDIREVYYYCLILGFRGKYYSDAHQGELDNLIADNLQLVIGPSKNQSFLNKTNYLFPDAYLPGREGTGIKLHVDYRPFAYGIPILVLLGLFYWLRLEIYHITNYLVSTL